MYIKINTASTVQDCAEIEIAANEIWKQHFSDIISMEQIEYMLNKYQSEEAIYEAINKDHKYYIAVDENNVTAGYCGIQFQGERIFLSKIYIKKEYRGKGIARMFFNEILKEADRHGAGYIWLTVNVKNESSVAVYRKMGFYVFNHEKEDIGNGFVKDDYIMRYDILNWQ